MIKNLTVLAGIATLLSIVASPAQAALIGVSAGGEIISPPDRALNSTIFDNELMLGFDEQQNVILSRDIEIDDPDNGPDNWIYDSLWSDIIPEGKQVDSHMILVNKENGQPGHINLDNVDWQFSGRILGVMSDRHGVREAMTTDLLGSTTTLYPTTGRGSALGGTDSDFAGFRRRGMERHADGIDFYEVLTSNTLRVDMRATQPGDWIRVVTMDVPEPGSGLVLLTLGALGAAGVLKRKHQ